MSPSLTPCGKEGQQTLKRASMNDNAYVDQQKSRRLLIHDARLHQGELLLRLLFKLLLALKAKFHRHGSVESIIPYQPTIKGLAEAQELT